MKIIGHRGARGLAPENTLTSIRKALEAGADEVEIDVRITHDDIPVLSHDAFVPADGKSYVIRETTLEELQKAKPDLLTLAEAIAAMPDKVVLRIEIKPGEPAAPVAAVIEKSGASKRLRIGSKSQKVLRESHALLPDIPKVVIEPWSGIRARYRARQVDTRHVSMRSWWLWRGFLRAMQKSGYQIDPYTMNDPKKVAKWAPYIDGVVTDFPDRFTGE